MDHWYDLVQLRLERRVEVLRAADGDEAERVGQFGEDTDFVVVLEVRANNSHGASQRWLEMGKVRPELDSLF